MPNPRWLWLRADAISFEELDEYLRTQPEPLIPWYLIAIGTLNDVSDDRLEAVKQSYPLRPTPVKQLNMVYTTPKLSVSENALHLILHAKTEILPNNVKSTGGTVVLLTSPFGRGTQPEHWLPEVTLLRLVAIVEAYMRYHLDTSMSYLVDTSDAVTRTPLSDFEVASTSNWDERHKAFQKYHQFSIKAYPSWQSVWAGIEVRNCMAHGLGKLTARQKMKTGIARQVSIIDVTVASNQMHLAQSTVPKLSDACSALVRSVDQDIKLSR